MAVSFEGTSSYIKLDTEIIEAVPFTIGMWILPRSVSALQYVVGTGDTGSSSAGFSVRISATGQWIINATSGGVSSEGTIAGAIANSWSYVLARFITTTNRRMSVLFPDGSISHAQNTTSRTPLAAEIDHWTIGARELATASQFVNGQVAEFFLSDADVQVDGAQTDAALVRQLAYGGPFSIPHVVNNIIEYHSFRVDPTKPRLGEDFYGRAGIQSWAAAGTPAAGPHPPLPYWFVRPNQTKRLLLV